MAKDVSDLVRSAVGRAAREALKNMGDSNPVESSKSSPLSGVRGLAAGAGLAALAPLAKKGFDAVRSNGGLPSLNPASLAGDAASKVGDKVSDVASDKVDEAGGAGGMLKDAVSGAMPFGGGDDDGGKGDGMPGVGKGRRMPIQQAVDVAVPLEVAYNQWTQYEDWPEFMHRVTRVTQDEETVSFATKIWGKTKEFKADIVTQRPDDRVKWRVSEGITHTGVVSFHELAPRLTRIEIDLDIDPGSLIEKAARGMRHIKRAVRADLHRFKAFIEMQEIESGAWRGTIEDGEVVEEHDESYDDDRDYAEVEDIYDFASPEDQNQDDDDGDEDQDDDDDTQERTERSKPSAEQSNGRSSKPRARSAATSKPAASRSTSSGRSRSNGSKDGGSTASKSSSSRSQGNSSKNGKSTAAESSSSRSRGGSAKTSSSGSRSKSTAKS